MLFIVDKALMRRLDQQGDYTQMEMNNEKRYTSPAWTDNFDNTLFELGSTMTDFYSFDLNLLSDSTPPCTFPDSSNFQQNIQNSVCQIDSTDGELDGSSSVLFTNLTNRPLSDNYIYPVQHTEDPDDIFLADADSTDNSSGSSNYIETVQACYGERTRNHNHYLQSSNCTPSLIDCPFPTPAYNQSNPVSISYQNIPCLPNLNTSSLTALDQRYMSLDENSDSDSEWEQTPRKGRRGSKSVLLWKFLLKMLSDPDYTPGILCWENKKEGVFKFVDTNAVAKLWGQQKHKQDMNFEKLSRGIRHYYKAGMMNRVEGRRLVYKFNWKKFSREHRPQVSFKC